MPITVQTFLIQNRTVLPEHQPNFTRAQAKVGSGLDMPLTTMYLSHHSLSFTHFLIKNALRMRKKNHVDDHVWFIAVIF